MTDPSIPSASPVPANPRIVTPDEARQMIASVERDLRGATRDERALLHTVVTEPDRTRAAVVKALRDLAKQHDVAEAYDMANAIENGADF